MDQRPKHRPRTCRETAKRRTYGESSLPMSCTAFPPGLVVTANSYQLNSYSHPFSLRWKPKIRITQAGSHHLGRERHRQHRWRQSLQHYATAHEIQTDTSVLLPEKYKFFASCQDSNKGFSPVAF